MRIRSISLALVLAAALAAGGGYPALASPPAFSIAITSTTPGPLSLDISGTASVTKFPGSVGQYNVQVDWGDGNVDPASTVNFTVSDKDFSGTWSNSHTYAAGGPMTITAKLYHAMPPGHESGDSTATVDITIPQSQASLTVIKNVSGGTASAADFTINISGTNASPSSFPGSATGTLVTMDAGQYSVSETPATDYEANYSEGCSGTFAAGDSATCTITNTFTGTSTPPTATSTLTVIKNVVNDNGGGASAGRFAIHVKSGDADVAGSPAAGSATGTTYILEAGTYVVSEDLSPGYKKTGITGDCAADGAITLAAGTSKTCVITNDDNAPGSTHTITVSAGPNGSVSPAGPVVDVDDGADQAFTFTPADNYVVDHLVVDGSSVTAADAYTFTGVTADHTLAVFFSADRSGGSGRPIGGGQVLGASTVVPAAAVGSASACGIYLDKYIKYGAANDPDQVRKLQAFLNGELNLGLPVTGIYDVATMAAVNLFQMKHAPEVLRPWVAYGLPSEQTPTGYVYKTTLRHINFHNCPSLDLPMPSLP